MIQGGGSGDLTRSGACRCGGLSRLGAIAVAAAVFGAVPATWAGEDEEGELPLETLALIEAASVQERLELEVDLVPTWLAYRNPDYDWVGAGLALELGIVDGFEVEVELTPAHAWTEGENATGLSNSEVGVGVALLRTSPFMLAAGVEVALPATDELLGEDGVGAEPYLLGDWGVGRFHIALLSSVEVADEDGELEVEFEEGVGLYVDLGPVVPTLETVVEIGDDVSAILAPGVFARVGELWQFGVAGVVGLTDDAPDYGVIGVIVFEAELAEDDEDDDEDQGDRE